MGKNNSTGRHLSRSVTATTMSFVMALAFTPAAAFAASDVDEGEQVTISADDEEEDEEESLPGFNYIILDEETPVYTGEALLPKVKVYDYDEEKVDSKCYVLSYERYDSDEDKYVAVSSKEVIEPGKYQVTATAAEGSGYEGSVSIEFTIVSTKNLDLGSITFVGEPDDDSYMKYDYTGKPITPNVVVKDAGEKVVPARNYKLSYEKRDEQDDEKYTQVSPNDVIENGVYRVTATAVEGSGYEGKISNEFVVLDQRDLSNGRVIVDDCDYTGKPVVPRVRVYDYNDELLDSTKYDLSYAKYNKDEDGDEDEDDYEYEDEYTDIKASDLIVPGKYRVTATAKNGSGYIGSTSSTFDILNKDDLGNGSLSLQDAIRDDGRCYYLMTGKPITPIITVYDSDGKTVPSSSYELSYQKDANDQEDSSGSGYVDISQEEIVETGDYRIIAKAADSSGYIGSVSNDFKIIDSKNLDYGNITVTDSADSYTDEILFTGKALSPNVVVKDITGNEISADSYKLSYAKYDKDEDEYIDVADDGVIETGEYNVTATGKEAFGYTGSCSETFKVVAPEEPEDPNSISSLEIDSSQPGYDNDEGAFDYSGKAVVPKLIVTTAGGKELSSGDYTVSYEKRTGGDEENNNATYTSVEATQVVEPGTYRVTVAGVSEKGYSGSESVVFRIVGNANLKDGEIVTSAENYPKTGKPIVPRVEVRTDSAVISSDIYDLSYEKAIGKDSKGNTIYETVQTSQVVDAGEYRVTATAKKKSGYVGKCSTTFNIFERSDLNHGKLDIDEYCFYTGKAVTPNIRVFDYDGHIVDPDAYSITYQEEGPYRGDNYLDINSNDVIEPGNYQVTISALKSKGYSGSCSESFRVIKRTDLQYCNISMDEKYYCTGKVIMPQLTVRDAAGEVISPEDYLVSYERDTGGNDYSDDYVDVKANELVEPGNYSVTIKPKPGSDYTGSRSVVFSIVDGTSLSDGGMVAGRYWYPKTDKSFAPDFTVFDGSGKVVDPKYYELSYKQRIESEEDPDVYKEIEVDAAHVLETGNYIVTATAKNGSGYTGNCSVGFTIYDSNEVHDWWLTAGETYSYTGKTIKPNIIVKDGSGATVSSDEYTLSYGWVDKNGDGDRSLINVTEDQIVNPGTYRVKVDALDGNYNLGSYYWDSFYVYSSSDLRGASFNIDGNSVRSYDDIIVAYNGEPIGQKLILAGTDGKTIDPNNYTLSCKRIRDNYSSNGITIDAAKVTDPGWYQISAHAKAGSGYTGSVSVQLHIVEPDEVDRAAAQWLNEQIAALPTEVTSAEQWRTVKDADQAYNRLEDAGMALIGAESLSKLKEAVASADIYIEKQEAQQQPEQPSTPADPSTPSKTDQPSSKTDQPSNSDTPATSDDVTKPATVTEATLNVKTVTVAAVKKALGASASTVTKVTLGNKVKTVKSGAFKGTKVKTLVVKTTKLTKKSVKKALKNSKVKTIQVKVGSKKANSKYLKKYKKIFTKKVCGKKVKVKL